jgi:omega-6 fatty acid desaturase (delta-12 desaturase)
VTADGLHNIKHFSLSSPLFKPHERRGIIASNIGLGIMACLLNFFYKQVGFAGFVRFYVVPYLVSQSSLSLSLLSF